MNFDYTLIFLQSNALELPFVGYSYRRAGIALGTALLATTFANLITHPVVFFGFMNSGLSYAVATSFAELFAVCTEAVLHDVYLRKLAQLSFLRCLATSACANLVSWQIAPLFTWLLLR